MKKIILPIAGLLVVAAGAAVAYSVYGPQENPDPNHTHTDFAIWIDGQQVDFSGPQYMSEAYEEGKEVRVDPMRKYLHLHDGNGHVAHRHKPGLTFGEFLQSLGIVFSKDGLNACMQIPGRDVVCEDEALHRNWIMMVNGERRPFFDTDYVFEDEDRILVLLPQSDEDQAQQEEVQTALDTLTNDACRYSKTCPWRGDPPTENCIADPTVPCVAPN